MRANYRIDWKSGMRLSDAVFNASDEYQIARFRPLYELMLSGGYGHLSKPRFRCEIDNAEMSVIEMNVTALNPAGGLIETRFDHNERNLFQKMPMPESHEPFIVYIEQSASEFDSFEDKGIPYKAPRTTLIFKPESVHYANPDAIALSRLEYKQCWLIDNTFIPPCVSLKANTDLWNLGHMYSKALSGLTSSLMTKTTSEMGSGIMGLLPVVSVLSTEVSKEMDSISPKHLVTIMQQVIGAVLSVFQTRGTEYVPEYGSCLSFVESEYMSDRIEPLVDEGIRLTQLLTGMVDGLRQPVVVEPEPLPQSQPSPARLPRQPRLLDTSSERKSFKSRK